jgi:hypothetical protein
VDVDPIIIWLAAAVVVVGLVGFMFKRAMNKKVRAFKERGTAEVQLARPISTPAVAAPRTTAPPRARTLQCEAIRQKLRLPLMYDEEKIDRLVATERAQFPKATDEQLHAAAYEHWVRDNRT